MTLNRINKLLLLLLLLLLFKTIEKENNDEWASSSTRKGNVICGFGLALVHRGVGVSLRTPIIISFELLCFNFLPFIVAIQTLLRAGEDRDVTTNSSRPKKKQTNKKASFKWVSLESGKRLLRLKKRCPAPRRAFGHERAWGDAV